MPALERRLTHAKPMPMAHQNRTKISTSGNLSSTLASVQDASLARRYPSTLLIEFSAASSRIGAEKKTR
jgi:hypothetical protein